MMAKKRDGILLKLFFLDDHGFCSLKTKKHPVNERKRPHSTSSG
jgi:hypothetical protein